ncbi:MAG: serine/threonine protein kinase [Planctomyces sp.]|nr:serine/threonine protein kinase [Planctomyces sp.]
MAADVPPPDGQGSSGEHEQLTRLGKYVIQKRLGAGGMGTVYLAVDSSLKRTIALKVLPRDRADNPTLVKRFQAEGQAAAYLQHKNIVGVYEAGQIDGLLYIALEYVEGIDVLDIIRKRGVIPVRRSIEIIRQVLHALQHACEKQIVHRDIKPSNLLVAHDGTVKLADLGLARSIDDTIDTGITRAGTTVGTVDYMSPEQARNSKAADIRSDIYSLGCTWYHMVAGVPPYAEGSMTNKLRAHAQSELPDPRERNDRIPDGVVAVIHRMMAKKPEDRYQSPQEILEELKNPVLTRNNLDAGVLAALAESGEPVSPNASTGDVAVDLDDVDLDEAIKPADGKPRVRDDDGGQQPTPAKNRKAPEPPQRRGSPDKDDRAVPRPEDDDWKSAPYKPKGRQEAVEAARARLPPRTHVADGQGRTVDRHEPARKGRKPLPARSDAVSSGQVKASLDPDLLKYGLAAGLVAIVLAALAFAFSRSGGGPPATTSGDDPYDNRTTVAPEVVPSQAASDGDGPANSQDTGPTAVIQDSQAAATDLPPVTPARRAAAPFAGAEDLELTGNAGREFIRDWAIDVRTIPDKVAPVVIRRGPSADAVPTFSEALARLPAGAAVIEFQGEGPFVVRPAELPSRTSLTIRGGPGERPVVIVSAEGLPAGAACLKSDGRVLLEGLHLVLAVSPDAPAGVVLLSAPAIAARDCTVTATGPAPVEAIAFDIRGGARDMAIGGVFENCLVRGSALTAVRLSNPRAGLLAGNCLFAVGRAPAIVAPSAAAASEVAPRSMALLGTTIVGARAFAIQHALAEPPARLELLIRDAVFLAPADAENCWLTAVPWPAGRSDDLESPVISRVSLKLQKSAFAGWSRLVRMETGGGQAVEASDDAGWKQFWRQSAVTIENRPALDELPEDLRRLEPADLETPLATAGLAAAGERLRKLPPFPAGVLRHALAMAERPRLPPTFIANQTFGAPIAFDLQRAGTLNDFLNDPVRCPDGSHVQLTGQGLKPVPPLKIQGKRLRLEFVHAETGTPQTVQPQVAAGERAAAWITVENGALDLVGARFVVPSIEGRPYPPTLLSSTGSELSIRSCSLIGAVERSSRPFAPLIAWNPTEPGGAALIQDSYLVGRPAVVQADLNGRLLIVENSVLAGLEDVFRITSSSVGGHAGALTVRDSTLAAGRAAYRIQAEGSASAPGLECIVSHAAYVPGFQEGGQTSPVVLEMENGATTDAVAWWEDGAGYGPQLAKIDAADPTSTRVADAILHWSRRWGVGHVLRPLGGPREVALARTPSEPAKSDARAFELAETSPASTWNARGGPIGARVSEVGPARQPPRPTGDQRPGTPPQTPDRSRGPDF